jgi:hypothetical protein
LFRLCDRVCRTPLDSVFTAKNADIHNVDVVQRVYIKMEGDGSKGKLGIRRRIFVLSRTETTWITNLYRWRWRCETIKAKRTPPCSTATCLLSTSNNYKNNENIRKIQSSKIFKSFILTPKDGVGNSKPKLTLTSNGDLVLTTGEQPQYNRVVWITVKVRLKIQLQ